MKFISSLNPDYAHSALFVIRWDEPKTGATFSRTLGKSSIEVTHKNSPKILASKVENLIEEFCQVYKLDPQSTLR